MEPQEGYHIRDLSYSVTGDNILVTTGSSTPMLYDRDGFLVAACLKGNLINIFLYFSIVVHVFCSLLRFFIRKINHWKI